MQVANYSEFRKNLKSHLDAVTDNHDLLVVHRQGGKSVVVLSIDDYNSMDATDYLLSSTANKESMYQMLEEDKAVKSISKSIEELKSMVPTNEQK